MTAKDGLQFLGSIFTINSALDLVGTVLIGTLITGAIIGRDRIIEWITKKNYEKNKINELRNTRVKMENALDELQDKIDKLELLQ